MSLLFAPKKAQEEFTYEESLAQMEKFTPEASWAETLASSAASAYETSPVTAAARKFFDGSSPISTDQMRQQYPRLPEEYYNKTYTANEARYVNDSYLAEQEYAARKESRNAGTLASLGYDLVGGLADPSTLMISLASAGVGTVIGKSATMATWLAKNSFAAKFAGTSTKSILAREAVINTVGDLATNIPASQYLGDRRYGGAQYGAEEFATNVIAGTALGGALELSMNHIMKRFDSLKSEREKVVTDQIKDSRNKITLEEQLAIAKAELEENFKIGYEGGDELARFKRQVYDYSKEADTDIGGVKQAPSDLFAVMINDENLTLEKKLGNTVVAFEDPALQEAFINKYGQGGKLYKFDGQTLKFLDMDTEQIKPSAEPWLYKGKTWAEEMNMRSKDNFEEFVAKAHDEAKAQGKDGFVYTDPDTGLRVYQIIDDAVNDSEVMASAIREYEPTGRQLYESKGDLIKRQIAEEGYLSNGKTIKLNEKGYFETDFIMGNDEAIRQGYVELFDKNHVDFIRENINDGSPENIKDIYDGFVNDEHVQHFKDLEEYAKLEEQVAEIELTDQAKKELADKKKAVIEEVKRRAKETEVSLKYLEGIEGLQADPKALDLIQSQILKDYKVWEANVKNMNPEFIDEINKASFFCVKRNGK